MTEYLRHKLRERARTLITEEVTAFLTDKFQRDYNPEMKRSDDWQGFEKTYEFNGLIFTFRMGSEEISPGTKYRQPTHWGVPLCDVWQGDEPIYTLSRRDGWSVPKQQSGPPKQFPHRLELRYDDATRQALDILREQTGDDTSTIIRRLIRNAV